MVKRYTAIVIIYLLCLLSPYIPGFMTLARKFPTVRQGYGAVYTTVFFVTLAIVLLLLWPDRQLLRDVKRASLPVSIVWAVGGVFALFALQMLATLINFAIFGQVSGSEHTRQVETLTRYSPVFLLTVSIVGPILEEIVFRKILFGSMRHKIGFWFAALISSLIFAVMHQDLHNLLVYVLIGVFLCFTYQMTHRIAVNMFMHATMNTVVVLISYGVSSAGFAGLF
ncbi:CPBP family intramembrane glutamic endopeptidase [Sporolactobacillus vineae]|uniref:CPBP family intramembrane glutamic endopeptidase n=1 Tax=Sporolactobacillus vineae TaxID=444463 RepID=UPI00028A172D|nr:CPBP family intramembrane glutamic endopeptidase [Sporolactobacillus vineae]